MGVGTGERVALATVAAELVVGAVVAQLGELTVEATGAALGEAKAAGKAV